jgi:hypothetical protein
VDILEAVAGDGWGLMKVSTGDDRRARTLTEDPQDIETVFGRSPPGQGPDRRSISGSLCRREGIVVLRTQPRGYQSGDKRCTSGVHTPVTASNEPLRVRDECLALRSAENGHLRCLVH